jgi:hypothetical protein
VQSADDSMAMEIMKFEVCAGFVRYVARLQPRCHVVEDVKNTRSPPIACTSVSQAAERSLELQIAGSIELDEDTACHFAVFAGDWLPSLPEICVNECIM